MLRLHLCELMATISKLGYKWGMTSNGVMITTVVHKKNINELERKTRPWYFFCRAGLQVASIQYNGDISACLDIERRPELIFGNIREDNLLDI